MKTPFTTVIAAHVHLGFEGISFLIQKNPRYQICSYEDQRTRLFDTLRREYTDLLIMCYAFTGESIFDTIKEIKQAFPSIGIVIISAQTRDFEKISAVYQAGANAFLCSATVDQQALFNALDHAVESKNYFTNSYKDHLIETILSPNSEKNTHGQESQPENRHALGQREIQVLCLIAKGQNAKEIAQVLDIAQNTVEVHRRNIMLKLNLRKSTDLTRYALKNGLCES
jgi:DNA-binding NarL/FixJ family response regulator